MIIEALMNEGCVAICRQSSMRRAASYTIVVVIVVAVADDKQIITQCGGCEAFIPKPGQMTASESSAQAACEHVGSTSHGSGYV